jgi:membrane-bound ClpP family serine protease
MIMAGSTIKALLGLFLFIGGTILSLMLLFLTAIFTFLGVFGLVFNIPAIVGSAIWGIAIAALLMLILGLKLFFDNETRFVAFLFGIAGLALFIVGVITMLGSEVSLGTSIIPSILLLSVGLAMMGYGFKIDFLKPAATIVEIPKKMISG